MLCDDHVLAKGRPYGDGILESFDNGLHSVDTIRCGTAVINIGLAGGRRASPPPPRSEVRLPENWGGHPSS